MNRPLKCVSLLALSLTAFLLFLNGPDIVTSHEARVALPARVMADSGWPWNARVAMVPPVMLRPGVVRLAPDWTAPPIPVNPWLVPVMSGQVRLQKPPLPYWCAAIMFRLFGGFSEIAVRFVPALLGALAALLVYDLGRLLYGRRVGWLAGIVWVSTYAIPEEYRKAMADPYLAFFTLACVWAWVRAGVKKHRGMGGSPMSSPHRANALHTSHRSEFTSQYQHMGEPPMPLDARAMPASRGGGWIITFYVSFAFALLAKGPPAFIDILLPIAIFQFCIGRRIPGRLLAHLAGIVIMLGISLPWAWYVWRNVPHAVELWRYESVGELADNTENARAWWFYLPQMLYLALPWTAVWGVGIVRQILRVRHRAIGRMRSKVLAEIARQSAESQRGTGGPPMSSARNMGEMPMARPHLRRDGRPFFPVIWYAAMIVFFSLVHLKKNQYLLPMLPAQTLLIAQGLSAILAGARWAKFKGFLGILVAAQTIIGIGFAAAIVGLLVLGGHPRLAFLIAAALSLIVALLPLRALMARRERQWPLLQAAAYMLLFLVFWRTYLTPKEDARSAKPVAAEVLELLNQPSTTLLAGRLPEELAVYLPLGVHYDSGSNHVLVIMDDQHDARGRATSHRPIPVPNMAGWLPDAKEARIKEIHLVPLKSAPGDARWKVWEITVDRSVYTLAANSYDLPQRRRDR